MSKLENKCDTCKHKICWTERWKDVTGTSEDGYQDPINYAGCAVHNMSYINDENAPVITDCTHYEKQHNDNNEEVLS